MADAAANKLGIEEAVKSVPLKAKVEAIFYSVFPEEADGVTC